MFNQKKIQYLPLAKVYCREKFENGHSRKFIHKISQFFVIAKVSSFKVGQYRKTCESTFLANDIQNIAFGLDSRQGKAWKLFKNIITML